MFVVLRSRFQLALTTLPTRQGWGTTLLITAASTLISGAVAAGTGFVDPLNDVTRPSPLKILSVFIFPSLCEELLWRGLLLPHPSVHPIAPLQALTVLSLHVAMHPIIGESGLWPRGRDTFRDARFLVLATIVLGGATLCYIYSGGSVYAATIAHAIPVTLWRDCFGGERKLGLGRFESVGQDEI